jgi:hypothetical protein
MSEFKVSNELREAITTYILEARWYVHSSKYGHDLDLDNMYMENGDKVADNIVNEVVQWVSEQHATTYQLKRIADSLEKLTSVVDKEGVLWVKIA